MAPRLSVRGERIAELLRLEIPAGAVERDIAVLWSQTAALKQLLPASTPPGPWLTPLVRLVRIIRRLPGHEQEVLVGDAAYIIDFLMSATTTDAERKALWARTRIVWRQSLPELGDHHVWQFLTGVAAQLRQRTMGSLNAPAQGKPKKAKHTPKKQKKRRATLTASSQPSPINRQGPRGLRLQPVDKVRVRPKQVGSDYESLVVPKVGSLYSLTGRMRPVKW